MSPGRKPVISRQPTSRNGEEVTFLGMAASQGRSRPVFAAHSRDLYVGPKTLRRNPDMFGMAVAGLAKSLIAVTITLNPAAAHHGSGS